MSESLNGQVAETNTALEKLPSESNKLIRLTKEVLNEAVKPTVVDLIAENTVHKNLNPAQLVDPFNSFYNQKITALGDLQILEPPQNPSVMRRIPMENNILLQCIEAMVQNIENTGHTLEYVGPEGDEESEASLAEKKRILSFLEAPNEEYSFSELRKRIRQDRETFGYAFFEIIRGKDESILAVYHIPAHTMRGTTLENEAVPVTMKLRRGENYVTIQRNKRYRRFVQINPSTQAKTYFKEFGDERTINRLTGKAEENVPLMDQATEVIMFTEYRSGHFYGVPRWINQMPSILGSRESELVNLEFFKDNAIPAMCVMVGGGALTQDSVEAIAQKFARGRGRERMNEVLVLEAKGDEDAGNPQTGQIPAPKIEMKAMVNERQTDALFQDFDEKCRIKIRSAFRLPPLVIGLSDDYTYATADASVVVVESQVFQPERHQIDGLINRYLLGDGINVPEFWCFKSNPVRISDKRDIVESLKLLDDAGALSPNDVIDMANSMFNLQIKKIDQLWGEVPYSATLQSLKNKEKIVGMEALTVANEQVDNVDVDPNDMTDAQKEVKTILGKLNNLFNRKED